MSAREALLWLITTETAYLRAFEAFCEQGSSRLRSQAWQFREELKDRGHGFGSEEVEYTLFGLARELLPDTPAARWDAEWAHELCKDALTRLAQRYAKLSIAEKGAVDLTGQDVWDERMRFAALANDPPAFRAALKGWARAGHEAMEEVRIKGGAA
jgi:hypothetical protein